MSKLQDKVAYVTGAGSGIGKAIAMLYAQEGAKVVVSDINEPHGNEVVELIKKEGGDAIFVKADTASAEDVERLVTRTVEQYGRLDIACNNAGIGGTQAMGADVSIEDWKTIIDINLNGVFYGCKYATQQMLKNGGGAIVNMGSIHSITAVPASVGYATAKHAVLGLTRNFGVEYASQNIRVNAIGPGYIDTPLLDLLPAEQKDALIAKHPIGRLGKAEEVANLALFLSTDEATFINGSYYNIDGGYTAV
ncbi:SDR family NAD(P)-dependent oxidoreductase [Sphingobacterium gobiense]|uniref:Short-chain dehydrogenase n=1 Tax=Sphingobacterium gobiense TaxID=1382456 RepID=A0A2S9JS37_9SPHI|nr:glucose 1-dehydrogenase [Sphingobacterium gobiense]PRD56089.1 short-chain dehydrogenase [Sphingobacterium gobiense]